MGRSAMGRYYDTVLICADSSSKLCAESGVDVQVVLLLLPMLLLSALPVRAQIAVSANDATEILVDGVRVMVANAPPDTVTLIDLSARPPKIVAELTRAVQLVRPSADDRRDAG